MSENNVCEYSLLIDERYTYGHPLSGLTFCVLAVISVPLSVMRL